ncbi:hypothetical protein ACEZDB_27390 [Streptacidiphilus sp. N1-3]|uniref:Uncharacterized protein n=1 Tax=Streptacidiphilus alkalitolerans TaxID=3342712 RepID=A0ABV6X915_9ACTN
MIPDLLPPGTTKTGYCGGCDKYTVGARVVAEVHGDTGWGGTVLRCTACDARAAAKRRHG